MVVALWYTASFTAAKRYKSLRYCGVFEGESFTCGFSLDCTNFHILAHSMVWSIACSCKKPPRHNCLLTFTIIYSFSFEEILLFHNNRMLNFTSILLMFSIWEEKLRRYESSRWCKFLYSLFIHEMLNFEFEWKLFDLWKVFLKHRAQSYTYSS